MPTETQFSQELESALSEVCPSEDPYDSASFNAVQYINQKFPTEQSLGNVEPFLVSLEQRMSELDTQLLGAVRQQSGGGHGQQDLVRSQESLKELFRQVAEIQKKSRHAERIVQDIFRDVKSLDYAKHNLTASVTVMRRMQMLVQAVDQLERFSSVHSSVPQHREAGHLLEATNQLLAHFEKFQNVPKINALRVSVENIQSTLKSHVMKDFARELKSKQPNLQLIEEGCVLVGALHADVRHEIVAMFCKQQLEDYSQKFALDKPGSMLDKTDKRFKWLKLWFAYYEEIFDTAFPAFWEVPRYMARSFCVMTKQHLSHILEQSVRDLDVRLLLHVIKITMDFEAEQDTRFAIQPEDPASAGETSKNSAKSFRGKISEVFEPYMSQYITLEDRNMKDKLLALLKAEKWHNDDVHSDGRIQVLESSTELFLYFKRTLKECSAITVKVTLLELSRLFKKYLKAYADALLAKIPGSKAASGGGAQNLKELSSKEELMVCLIINTAEYCYDTVSKLEDTVRKQIQESLSDQVDFSGEQDHFSSVITAAVSAVIASLTSKAEVTLNLMTKIPWGTLQEVGDQSEYVNQLSTLLYACVPKISAVLTHTYFRFFCDKFVAEFIPRFVARIHKCRRFNDSGAQQLLIDSQSIKALLLDTPNMLPTPLDPSPPLPANFERFVKAEMGRVEAMAKVLMSPPEALIDNFKELLNGSHADLNKILELKGIVDKQKPLFEALESSLSSSNLASTLSSNLANIPRVFQK